jgi:hypothetical protein
MSIDDFNILKPISRGAFGRVYLAEKKSTGACVFGGRVFGACMCVCVCEGGMRGAFGRVYLAEKKSTGACVFGGRVFGACMCVCVSYASPLQPSHLTHSPPTPPPNPTPNPNPPNLQPPTPQATASRSR